jgi:hypothetical protein
VLAGVATIAGVGWTIFQRESTEVPEYRRTVLSTSGLVRSLLAGYPPDVLRFEAPGTLVVADKQALVRAMRERLTNTRSAFDELNARPVPGELAALHERAAAQQQAWYAAVESNITAVRARLRAGDPVSRVSALGQEVGVADATIALNTAMSRLAADDCALTGEAGPTSAAPTAVTAGVTANQLRDRVHGKAM